MPTNVFIANMCVVCHIESMGFPMNRWWWWWWWRWWHVCVPSWLINIILDSNATIHSVRLLHRYSQPICLSRISTRFSCLFFFFFFFFFLLLLHSFDIVLYVPSLPPSLPPLPLSSSSSVVAFILVCLFVFSIVCTVHSKASVLTDGMPQSQNITACCVWCERSDFSCVYGSERKAEKAHILSMFLAHGLWLYSDSEFTLHSTTD